RVSRMTALTEDLLETLDGVADGRGAGHDAARRGGTRAEAKADLGGLAGEELHGPCLRREPRMADAPPVRALLQRVARAHPRAGRTAPAAPVTYWTAWRSRRPAYQRPR